MLKFAEEKCTNCRICEEVCSYRLVNAVRPSVAAIRIDRREGRWGTPFAKVCNLCQGLDEPQCVASCPVEALSVEGGVIVWDEDACTRCEECVDACPNGAVAFDSDADRVNICDLCQGEPLCAQWCPEGVISL